MTPEEEWLASSLKADRERRMFREMFEPDERVRVWSMHGRTNSFAWVCYAVAVFLIITIVAVFS